MKKVNHWILLATLTFVRPALSQSVQDAPSAELTEIVVTAERRSENLQKVPIVVTAISAEQMSAAVIRSTQDLAAVVPGLTFPSNFEYALPHIRGVGSSIAAPGAENSVALYVDGVYFASSVGGILTLNNASQVEVLKGPQGTLFGRNATGGLIQVLTKDPSQTPSFQGNITYGNYQTTALDIYATHGLTNTLAADFAIQVSNQGQGWGRNVFNGEDVYKLDRDLAVRSKFLWTPTDSTKVKLSFDYENNRNSIPLQEAPFTAAANPFYPPSVIMNPPYDINENIQPLDTHNSGGLSIHVDQGLGFADLIDITAYRRSADYLTLDFDLGPSQLISDISNQTDEQFSEELQLRSNGSGSFKWTAGLFYFHAKDSYDPLHIGLGGPVAPEVGPGAFLTDTLISTTQTTESLAGFLQGTYEIAPSYNLTTGIRYTHEKRSFDGSETGLINGTIPIPLVTGYSPSFSINKPTWRVALDHNFTDQVMGYVSYNRGFKSGGYNTGDATSPPFQTEQLDAYEIGLKTEVLDRRVRINSAAFYYDYKNIQVTRYLNGSPFIYNGSNAKIYGFDEDIDTVITDHFQISAGFEALHDYFTNFPCAPFFSGGPNLSSNACSTSGVPSLPYSHSANGNNLPATPNFSSSVTFHYHTPVMRGEGDLSVTDAYNSGFYYEPNNESGVHQHAYNLINSSATWTSQNERYLVRLWGKNLFDKRYTFQLDSAPTGIAAGYAPPRTYGITLGTKF